MKKNIRENRIPLVRHELIVEILEWAKNDTDTLELLKNSAQNDDDSQIRCAAIQQLLKGWGEKSDLTPLLIDITLNDSFIRKHGAQSNPRLVAIEGLVKYYSHYSGMIDLLQDRCDNDPDKQLREWARQQLGQL